MSIDVDDGIDSTPDWTPDSSDPVASRTLPRMELVEPDWTRLPAGRTSSPRSGLPPNGSGPTASRTFVSFATCSVIVDESFYADLERDQAERATMSMLVPPQMINTMVPGLAPLDPGCSPTRSTATQSGAI